MHALVATALVLAGLGLNVMALWRPKATEKLILMATSLGLYMLASLIVRSS